MGLQIQQIFNTSIVYYYMFTTYKPYTNKRGTGWLKAQQVRHWKYMTVYSKQFEVELVDIMHKNSLWMRTLYTCTYT